jgi:spore germination protein KA
LEEGINNGDTAIIFDGIAEGVIVNTRGWEHRSIERPNTEPTVRGSQAGFTENLRTNTTLIRTIMRTSDLVTEMLKVGTRSKTNVALVYLKNVANPQLVGELRRRIQGVRTDNIDSSGTLIQFIEDHPILPFPQSLSTEHPDRVMPHLSEGRLALIVDGNPYIHVLPVSFFTLFHSAEDFGMPILVANFMRLLRLFGALLATLLPSLYIAISYFHVEALPTQLLLAIAGSREEVPFAAWFEVLIMEISFELIREAGVRVPGILGSTIGIVGAIILGQAAISAHVVSPAVVVVIAITGLASFTIPDYHMAASIRLVRFLLLLFSTFMGLVGLATILLWLTVILCSMKSFGMPYMVPVGPATNRKSFDVVIRGPVYSQKVQLDAINTKPDNRQPRISRSWIKRHPVEKEDE